MIDKYPKVCNLCGGKVIYTNNKVIYGTQYGSGRAYLCTECGAYVGTHKPRPREALGVLANKKMRLLKIECHKIFDSMWRTQKQRKRLYYDLSKEMGIPLSECHFGYFDLDQLHKAHEILKSWERKR